MPKLKIKGVTVRVKRQGVEIRKSKNVASLAGTSEINSKDGKPEGVAIKVQTGTTTEQKLRLLLNQNTELCKRIAKLEGVWYKRLWRFMNKPIGRAR